jgi:hypothetical protein
MPAPGSFTDARITRKLGNMNLTSSLEFTVAGRPYVEPQSQAQRSVISTSASDSAAGAGARRVRIVYLDSNYVKKVEEVTLQGLNGVNTTATDIRFIEDFYVCEGTNAVGRVYLASGLLGTGSDICAIPPATTQAFLCHHYVPSGSNCYVIDWGATSDRDVEMRLKGQLRTGSFLVDEIVDLEKMYGQTSSLFGRVSFNRTFVSMKLDPMTYIRVTVQPSGSYSTTTRAFMDIWEE